MDRFAVNPQTISASPLSVPPSSGGNSHPPLNHPPRPHPSPPNPSEPARTKNQRTPALQRSSRIPRIYTIQSNPFLLQVIFIVIVLVVLKQIPFSHPSFPTNYPLLFSSPQPSPFNTSSHPFPLPPQLAVSLCSPQHDSRKEKE